MPGREGACLFGCRLTVPFRNLQGVACLACRLPDLAVREPTGAACLLCRLLPPAFSLLSCPYPPSPLPLRGRGRPRLFYARGFAPCIPGLDPGRHWGRGRTMRPAGGLPSLSPAAPAFSLLCRPHPPAPFPGGEGGHSKFILPGATAPGTPALNRLRHLQSLPLLYPAEACRALFPAALAIPAPGERTISNAAVACDG